MAVLPPTSAVLRSYRLSRYHAGDLVLRVDRQAPRGLPGAVVLLSACNPGGRRMPDGWNRRMMAGLATRLRGHAVVAGEGRLHRWTETLFLTDAPAAPMLRLARQFRQNAVILAWPGRRTRLVLL